MNTLIPTLKNGSKKDTDLGFNSLPSLPSWFDDFLGKSFGNEFMSNFNTGITLPAVNVIDEANDFVVEMAVPGLNKSDFNINIDNHVLSIGVEKETKHNESSENYTRREFGYSSFKRTFSIPESVDVEKISATYKDGIMRVVLPKRDEAKKKPIKTIEIK
ncbi:Hsp20/alpha crystallin family protein [Yeosuana marina]|uniref:Hsp20/alpha crystallin family protein n=1 Tax=Yeosuana marina TaxID=1565536 RepID=UPI0030EE81B5|tara:strand:+ start:462 stop:941 length:480 start_codon:yes stop_codon:yes gene_type:complete